MGCVRPAPNAAANARSHVRDGRACLQPVEVPLDMFTDLQLVEAEERTLTLMHAIGVPGATVTLRPQEIRTFLLQLRGAR